MELKVIGVLRVLGRGCCFHSLKEITGMVILIFFKNVIDLFLMAGNRKEVYQRTIQQSLQQSPVLEWLKMQLELPGCQLKWGGLNARHFLYASFLEGKTNREDYNPKRISQLFYQALPECRPSAGKRIRQRGVAMMYLPVREHCQQVLDHFEKNNLLLVF